MLQVRNLTVAYGKAQVVHDISLEVPKGRIVALLGPNGAGKTTTLESHLRWFYARAPAPSRWTGRISPAQPPMSWFAPGWGIVRKAGRFFRH